MTTTTAAVWEALAAEGADKPFCAMPDPDNRFTGLPVSVSYIDGRTWRLTHDASYRTVAGPVSTVQAGFEFDWASVPWWLWGICPPAGLQGQPYGLAAMWHDWLYRHHAINGVAIERKVADDLFLEIMLYVGVSRWRARVMWMAVRGFGWAAWKNDQPEPPTISLTMSLA